MISSFTDKYAFLSNFYPCIINEERKYFEKKEIPELNITDVGYDIIHHFNWPSAEHYYQSLKTINLEEKIKVFLCKTPGQAKRMGNKLTLISNWEKIKVPNMEFVVTEKFRQNKDLLELLLNTYPERLLEGNYWHDNFWGKCLCKKCSDIITKNHLGIILMSIRNQYMILKGGIK